MRKFVVVCVLTMSALFGFSTLYAVPVHTWSTCYGGPGINTAYDVAVDGSGSIVIAGSFAGTMNLGGGVLTSAGGQDMFLARYDAHGAHLWSQRFGGIGNDVGKAVTVDGAGNIIMTGHFRGPVSIGGAPLAGRGLQDIFVAKFDAAGLHQWSQWYGSAGGDEGQDIVSDASGNVIVTGHYAGAINFGGGADTPAFGSLDMFVLKLNAAGGYQWSKGVGNVNPDAGLGVAVDAFNSVFVAGMFSNTVNFGGGGLTSSGSTDVFVVKYDADGAHQWSTRLGGPTGDMGQGIGVDANGNVVVTGTYNDAFLVHYDTNGVQQWSRSFDSTDMAQGLDLAITPAGAIAITGNLRGTADFGGGPLTSAGNADIFLAIYESTGDHRWSQRFGNTGDDWGHGCAFNSSGDLIASGIFAATVNFGGAPLVSAGLSDVYRVRFDDEDDDPVDTAPPVIICPAGVQVELTSPDGTPATHPVIAAFLAGASASDNLDPAPGITHDAPAIFSLGTTTVTFRATDASGNYAECTSSVTVLDTTVPQIIVVLDKNVLWPPNHQFVTVCAQVTVSDNGPWEPIFWLVSITSNEPVKHGTGQPAQDIRGASFGTPDLCFDLRAERSGSSDYRVYEIVYAARAGTGNPVYATAFVRVPHDMSPVLTSVHPNPFNPQATLEYTLWEGGQIQLAIYDARGSLVRRLVDQNMPAGEHRVVWNGADQTGLPVASGIYFVRLSAGSQVDTRKIVLLK